MTEAERLSAKLDLIVYRYSDEAHYEAACMVDAEYWTVGARKRLRGVPYEESVDTMQWRLMALAALTNPNSGFGYFHTMPCVMDGHGQALVLDVRGAAAEMIFLAALLGGL